MKILHVSSECYPAAKAGGLADVVGALPKYLREAGLECEVIIPKYKTKWINEQRWEVIDQSFIHLSKFTVDYTIERCISADLGFELKLVNMPRLYYRAGIYLDDDNKPYEDSPERSIAFQVAVLQHALKTKPDLIHCHDHHTGLIPFMMKYAYSFKALEATPSVFTIHNGIYHGDFDWNKATYLPQFDTKNSGLIDWDNQINPLAAGIKNAWRVTTVSPGYLEELKEHSAGLEWLFRNEAPKCFGILNGIDTDVWNPATDPLLNIKYKKSLKIFKTQNKEKICQDFDLNPALPLYIYIGRIMPEKGVEELAYAIGTYLSKDNKANFVILGTGLTHLEGIYKSLGEAYTHNVHVIFAYNEGLAHELYAAADFLFMPSFVEPCGLNQMYSLRYGTVPIVSNHGGLRDSVVDINMDSENGSGIKMYQISFQNILAAIYQGLDLFEDTERFEKLRNHIASIDNSWQKSAQDYIDIYKSLFETF